MTDIDAEATPLELIERTVLDHAKSIRLDLDDDAAKARMRELIDDAVSRWSADYRRGLRTHDLADPDLVVERAYRNLVGYGPLESLLADDDVWEMMIGTDLPPLLAHCSCSGPVFSSSMVNTSSQ